MHSRLVFLKPVKQMIYFDVRVKPNEGIGKVKLLASSGKEKADYEVELDIRNPNPPITHVTEMTLTARTTMEYDCLSDWCSRNKYGSTGNIQCAIHEPSKAFELFN